MTAKKSPVQLTLASLSEQIGSLFSELGRWRDRADGLAQSRDEWKDRAFRQNRETIQKGIEAAHAKKEQKKAEEQARGFWEALVNQEGDIRDLKERLRTAEELVEAYRKAGMLEHMRAEAGEQMIAAMKKDRKRAS